MKVKQRSSFAQLVGTSIKRYGLIQLIQQEQHGATFLARHTGAEQICLLHLLTLSAEITAQERLILLGQAQQEISHIAALQHPVIQPILEYGHEQGMMYLVTPFIPMRYALVNILAARGTMDVTQAGYNLELLASALEYAHKHALIHGNLTASSVFLRPSSGSHPPTLLLTDVGIAHLQTLLMSSDEVSQHAEHFTGRPIDAATDVFALGALLYQMLTAHEAVPTGGQRLGKQVAIPPLKTWRQDLPTQLDAVIDTACRGGANRQEQGAGEAQSPVPSAPIVQASYQSPDELVDAYYQAVMPGASRVSTDRVGEGSGQGTGEIQDPVPMLPASPSYNSSQKEPNSIRTVTASLAAGQMQRTGQTQDLAVRGVPALARRKLTLALVAVGGGILIAGGGWLFFQSQQRPQEPQRPIPTSTPRQQTQVSQTTPSQQPTNNGKIIARTADLPVNHASTFAIPNSQSTNPGVLIHLPDNRFVAFDSTCTHQGCPVSYNSTTQQLECPCHGAVFDPAKNAAVLAGPAPTPLAPINIHVNADGTITVQ